MSARKLILSIPLLQKGPRSAVRRPPADWRADKRYPLELMLEPLFRCNLACADCGKIDYPRDPQPALVSGGLPEARRRMRSPGGFHRRRRAAAAQEINKVVEGIIARRKFATCARMRCC
jgi:hypothetical protein